MLQVVVMVSRYDGPLHIHPDTLRRIEEMRATDRPEPVQRLTRLQEAILGVLEPGVPAKALVIAMRLKRSCNGGFRGTLSLMVRLGMLRKVDGGYVK